MPMGESGLIVMGFDEVFLYLTIPWVFTNLSINVSTRSPQKNFATPVPHIGSQNGASTLTMETSPGWTTILPMGMIGMERLMNQ